ELQSPGELCSDDLPCGRWCGRHDLLDALRMQISAEALKLSGQQDGIGPVDLLRGISPPWPRASNVSMSGLDLVQDCRSPTSPLQERIGGHRWVTLSARFLGSPCSLLQGKQCASWLQ